MNSQNNILPVPRYEDVVAAFGLESFLVGGDLQLTETGDIAVTKDGDLKFGNDCVNAMFRLIQRWRFNTPTLSILFDTASGIRERRLNLDKSKDDIAAKASLGLLSFDSVHAVNDEIGAVEFGSAAYAGTIMVVQNNLLRRFHKDLNATDEDWLSSTPSMEGCSVGTIIDAAANNFRHHDEWARTDPPTSQQLKSLTVIAAVLKVTIAPNGERHPFRRNMCSELLHVLSDGTYDQLNHNFFAYAKSMVERHRTRNAQ